MLRELLSTFIRTLIGAEADALCGAGYGQRSGQRSNSRNGYRYRQFDTRRQLRFGNPEAAVRFRLPDWLPERRKRAEQALTTVVAACYLIATILDYSSCLCLTEMSNCPLCQAHLRHLPTDNY